MDFLKSCTTNLYAVEGYSSIEYQIYVAPSPPPPTVQSDTSLPNAPADHTDPNTTGKDTPIHILRESWIEERHAILLALRQKGSLVQSAAVQKKICVFGGFQIAEDHMNHLGWPLALTGRLHVTTLTRPTQDAKVNLTNQNIYAMFLSSVEESLSIALATNCHAIRVGHMTWIVPTCSDLDSPSPPYSPPPDQFSTLSLRAQITPIGNLLLLPEIVPTNCNTVDYSPSRTSTRPIILAPSGTPATTAPPESSSSRLPDQVDGARFRREMRKEARARIANKTREDGWKSAVRARLRHSTAVPIHLDDSTDWTRVSLPNPKHPTENSLLSPLDPPTAPPNHTCLWPTQLCFEKTHSSAVTSTAQDSPMSTWLKTYQDPLLSAERWLLDKNKRAQQDLLDQKKRDADMEKESLSLKPDQVIASSPVNIRAPQDQTSMLGIYPTPPDALPPGPFNDSAPPPFVTEDGTNTVVTEDYALAHQPCQQSSSALDLAPSSKNSADDLFDDMDDEMFGAPDVNVTDADFNFFDDNDRQGVNSNGSSNIHGKVPASTLIGHDPPVFKEKPEVAPSTAPLIDESPIQHIQDPATSGSNIEVSAESRQIDQDTLPNLESVPTQNRSIERLQTPPLSPAQLKQKFLPATDHAIPEDGRRRRASNFDPVSFNADVTSFDAKYRALGRFGSKSQLDADTHKKQTEPSAPTSRTRSAIDLPPRKPFSRTNQSGHAKFHDESSGDESDTTSASSASESPHVVAPSSKRKRPLLDDSGSIQSPRTHTDIESDAESAVSEGKGFDFNSLLDVLLSRDVQRDVPKMGPQELQHRFGDRPSVWRGPQQAVPTSVQEEDDWWDCFDFTQEDFISVAQLVAQQSIGIESSAETCELRDQSEYSDAFPVDSFCQSQNTIYSVAQSALRQVFSGSVDCDFSKLASIITTHAEQSPALKGGPTPAPRRLTAGSVGPQHLFAIQPPPVHLQRAGSPWELLPSSFKFWEPLSLEPASGAKNVVSYALCMNTPGLRAAVDDFLGSIGSAYENSKLGSHTRGNTGESNDGLMAWGISEPYTPRTNLEDMCAGCSAFGDLLRDEYAVDVERTVVIYMFTSSDEETSLKYLCACFWVFQQAFAYDYSSKTAGPDLNFVLQVVPLDRIANPDNLALPNPTWFSSLARQVYDRIPVRTPADTKSPWVIPSAPCVQLASPLPRKINFALHQRPPKSLLDEAQILHVAYAINTDNTWLTAAWSDPTGRYQFNSSFFLKGVDGKAVLGEVRDITLALARSSTWRIFVARVGAMRNWEKEVWKERPASRWAIYMMDIDMTPTLQISSTDLTANFPAVPQPGNGFATQASTPQPITHTVSPEAHGGVPTPSTPIETQEPLPPPPDPEAYLIDATDESWGLVLPLSAVHGPYELKRTQASGVLLKRGPVGARVLPSLAVDVLDTLMPKLEEGQANWLQLRTADAVLREVLSWYRGLGLLTRIRGLDGSGAVPWHVKVAVMGAEALTGFMD